MKTLKAMTAAAAIAMLAAQPADAAANAAQKLSLTNAVKSDVRASAKAGKSKAGGATIAIIAGIAVVVGIVLIASDDDSDSK